MRLIRLPRLVAAASAALVLSVPAVASGAPQWNNGALVESTITDCGSIIEGQPFNEAGLGATASVYEDYNNPPSPGQGYYLGISLFGVGNPCDGQAADITVAMPASTTPNVTAATPVFCRPLEGQSNGTIATEAPDASGGCPQAGALLSDGRYRFDMAAPAGFFNTSFYPFWGIAQNAGIEMDIPVVSSAQVAAGTATGVIQVADGNSGPTLRPTVPVVVGPPVAPPTQPASPQYAVTNPSVTGLTQTTATLNAVFVYDYSTAVSNTTFDYGLTVMTELGVDQSVDFGSGAVPYDDERSLTLTGLTPGCTYHWMAQLDDGAKATTPDMTFTTSGTHSGSCMPPTGTSKGAPTGVQQIQPVAPATPLTLATPPLNVVKPTPTPQPQPSPPPPPGPSDLISKLSLPSSTIHAASGLAITVTLRQAGKVKVTIIRHVPASGHGKHRRKAHDVTVGSKTFTGKVGVNRLKLVTLNGHRLAKGRYDARISAGGKAHTLHFTVR